MFFDVYSLGGIIKKVFSEELKAEPTSENTPFLNTCFEVLKMIQERCLDPNPDDRISASEIFSFLEVMIQGVKNENK